MSPTRYGLVCAFTDSEEFCVAVNKYNVDMGVNHIQNPENCRSCFSLAIAASLSTYH